LLLKGEEGRNANDIQLHCVRTSQDSTRFKGFLEDLCELGRIEKKDRSAIFKGLITYNITDKGKETVQKLRDPLVRDLLEIKEEEI
jgi:hypothetical protein